MKFDSLVARTLLAGVSLLSSAAFAQVDLARSTSCDNCTEQQRAQIVTSLAKVPGESQVLIVDAVNRRLHFYDVWVDQEPGLFHVTMDERTAPPEAATMLDRVLTAFPTRKEFEVGETPSICMGEGSSVAANYVSDGTCRGWVNELVRNSYRNSAQARISGPWAMQILTAYTRTAQGPRKVKILIRAPDNSRLEVEADIEIDIDLNVIITNIVVKLAIANSVELPLNAADLRGQTYSAHTAAVLNDFRRLFSNWSVDNNSQCATRQRIVCPAEPGQPCTSYIDCAPSGRP